MITKFYARQFLLLIIILFKYTLSLGQIYSNTFTGVSACPTPGNTPTPISGVTGTPLTRNTITCTPFANAFNSTTLNNTAAINDNSYIEFSVTADAGSQLNVTSLSFFRQGSASAPNQLEIRYSTDNFATSTAWGAAPLTVTSPGATTTWDFNDFMVASGVTLTFRIYPYGTQRADLGTNKASAGASFRIDALVLNGTVISPMPVKLSSFSGSSINSAILLKWETTSEDQNEGFEIEKSNDALQFHKIGYVKGNVTTKSKSSYEFMDTEIQSDPILYFRLKQIDVDGSFEYSRTIGVQATSGKETFIFPNPNRGNFTLKFSETENPQIRFLTALGVEIPIRIVRSENSNTYQITTKNKIAAGIYELVITEPGNPSQSRSLKVLAED